MQQVSASRAQNISQREMEVVWAPHRDRVLLFSDQQWLHVTLAMTLNLPLLHISELGNSNYSEKSE